MNAARTPWLRRSPWNWVKVSVVILLAIALASEAILYVPPIKSGVSLAQSIRLVGGHAYVNSSLSASFDGNFREVYTLRSTTLSFPTIFYYYDPAYPWSWSNPIDGYGLSQHLTSVLDYRLQPTNVVVINASALASVVRNPSTESDLIVMVSGVLPHTVFTNSTNLLRPWIVQGGTLLWIGDVIGYYSGQPNVPLQNGALSNPGNSGVAQFLNTSLFGGVSYSYDNATPYSAASGLTFPYGFRDHGLNVTRLGSGGGAAIGNEANGFTNVARIPLGSGVLYDFSMPLVDPTVLSVAVVNMLQLGILNWDVRLLGLQNLAISAGRSALLTADVGIPQNRTNSAWNQFCVFVAQYDLNALYSNLQCADLP